MESSDITRKSYFHSNTSLKSITHPITLRNLRPGEGAVFAALIANPENEDKTTADAQDALDETWGEGVIQRMTEYAKTNPTVIDASTGQVVSGPNKLNLAVVENASDGRETIIGISGYGAIKDWERQGVRVRAGDVGVVINAAYRGKGYAVEAMRLAMDWAAAPATEGGLQLDMLTATTLDSNEPMIRLIEVKLGLKGMGILRPAEFDRDKQELYFEITASEWRLARSRKTISCS